MICDAARNSACSSRNSAASASRCMTSASTLKNGLRSITTPTAPPTAKIAATKKQMPSRTAIPTRRASSKACARADPEQHFLGEDQVAALVVGELVVLLHRDRIERAC